MRWLASNQRTVRTRLIGQAEAGRGKSLPVRTYSKTHVHCGALGLGPRVTPTAAFTCLFFHIHLAQTLLRCFSVSVVLSNQARTRTLSMSQPWKTHYHHYVTVMGPCCDKAPASSLMVPDTCQSHPKIYLPKRSRSDTGPVTGPHRLALHYWRPETHEALMPLEPLYVNVKHGQHSNWMWGFTYIHLDLNDSSLEA